MHMQESVKQLIGNIFLTVLCALILGATGVYNIVLSRRCCVEVETLITEMEPSVSRDENGKTTTTYRPVYQFTYNGQEYVVYGHGYSGIDTYVPGDTVTLRINPDQPEKFFDPWRDRKIVAVILIFPVVGLLIGILGIRRYLKYR